jgi:RNA polymerase sigma-70 factor (ECF subfamily)
MSASDVDFSALMRQSQSGDKRAYATLLDATARLLRPYLSKRLSRNGEVDDVLQEILISIHRARHTYDGVRPYKPWAFAIARFRLHDHLRRHYADGLRGSVELTDAEMFLTEEGKDGVTFGGISYESIRKEIDRLPEKQARILTLMHHEGCTSREVAEKTGMKESAVKVAAHRAYRVLKKRLSD